VIRKSISESSAETGANTPARFCGPARPNFLGKKANMLGFWAKLLGVPVHAIAGSLENF